MKNSRINNKQLLTVISLSCCFISYFKISGSELVKNARLHLKGIKPILKLKGRVLLTLSAERRFILILFLSNREMVSLTSLQSYSSIPTMNRRSRSFSSCRKNSQRPSSSTTTLLHILLQLERRLQVYPSVSSFFPQTNATHPFAIILKINKYFVH